MIFLQARPSSGRLIVPQLCLHNADGIPTYATSEIHDPDPSVPGRDDDLDSVMFPELPILAQPAGLAAAQALSEFSTDNATREIRLFAFGFDAYELVERLYARGSASWPMPGATGQIYLDDTGRIRRLLPFAELRSGRLGAADAAIGLNCVN
jgi:outer membrane PBP1 activator LpoA protein